MRKLHTLNASCTAQTNYSCKASSRAVGGISFAGALTLQLYSFFLLALPLSYQARSESVFHSRSLCSEWCSCDCMCVELQLSLWECLLCVFCAIRPMTYHDGGLCCNLCLARLGTPPRFLNVPLFFGRTLWELQVLETL